MPLTTTANPCSAKALSLKNRKRLALEVMKNKQTITERVSEKSFPSGKPVTLGF